MEKWLTVLAGNNWITAHEVDEALREYKNLVSNMVKDKRDEMIAFNIVKQGLDLYFTDYIESLHQRSTTLYGKWSKWCWYSVMVKLK